MPKPGAVALLAGVTPLTICKELAKMLAVQSGRPGAVDRFCQFLSSQQRSYFFKKSKAASSALVSPTREKQDLEFAGTFGYKGSSEEYYG